MDDAPIGACILYAINNRTAHLRLFRG